MSFAPPHVFDGASSNYKPAGLRVAFEVPALFADRFDGMGSSADTQSPTVAQLGIARDSLAAALAAQQPSSASSLQIPASKPVIVPIPKSRPAGVQLVPQPSASDALSMPADDPVKAALGKVLAFTQPSGPQLASLAPDGGLSDDGKPTLSGRFDRLTAVYDISAKVVYMPDGTRLEAHSGLGDLMDDPNHVAVKNRGPTPPNIYELKMRESRFHGVQAIRMHPVGSGDLFGRSGLLTHSYLMGPNGDSNGCVSFKDYEVFLQAFLKGEVKRLVVVKSLTDIVTDPAKA